MSKNLLNMNQISVDTVSTLLDNIHLGDQTQPNILKNDDTFEIKNKVTIPPWLEECETPFVWHLKQERGLGSELVIMRTLEKLDDLLIEEPEFSIQRFVSLLKLVLEYYITGDIDNCCKNMEIIDGCLEEEISRNEPCYQKVKLSLGHVVSATKAHVLYILGKEEESKKIGNCIIPVKIMTDIDKATLSAMKARFFLYSGYENGEAVGVEYAREALELQPDDARYKYLLAKMLRQQRRDALFSIEVPKDEVKLLESAVSEEKNPKYIVYLAQVYRECATQAAKKYRTFQNFDSLKPEIDKLSQQALKYYKEALAMSPESPAALRRIGYGIMNLNKKYADYDLALDCLVKSLEISENQVTLHMLGTFYLRYKNDKKKALEYFEKTAITGSHAGLSDMVRVKWMLDPDNYDPCPDLQLGLSWKLKKKDHNQLLAQLGGYHLLIKRDFNKASEYFKQILLEDNKSPQMASFKSFFLKMSEPINLNEYLANEALLLAKKTDSAEAQTGIQGYGEDILELILQVDPKLIEKTPDENLIPKLLKAAKDMEASWNHNSRGKSHFRGNYSGNRGRSNYHRGGYRGGQSNANSRASYEDNERRANQRDQGADGDVRRGGFNRGRGGRQRGGWRARPRNDEREHENWREK